MKLAFLLCMTTALTAQNLVKNPSFEEGAACNGEDEKIDSVAHWRRIAGSPTFTNPQCPLSEDAKTFIQGMRLPPAFTGDVYVGMGMDAQGEFLQGTLERVLEKGEVYWVKMRVRLPVRFCNLPVQEMGVFFSADLLPVTEEYLKLDVAALALRRDENKNIDGLYDWQEVSLMYTAKGDEKYITFGNFAHTNETVLKTRKQGECTYVFVDNMSVEKFKEVSLLVFQANMNLVQNERIWLKNITFAKEKWDKNGEKELRALADLMTKNPNMRVEISAHTDNSQETKSPIRAQMVTDYLTKKGIDARRIQTVSKGSLQNITPNNSPENIAKNNRIEMKILAM